MRLRHAELLSQLHRHDATLAALDELLAPPFGEAQTAMRLVGNDEAAALELRARCFLGLGSDDEALEQLQALREMHPDRPSARRTAAEIYMRRGETPKALRELTATSLLLPSDRELCAQIMSLSLTLVDRAAADARALKYLDALIATEPSPFALLERAKLRAAMGGLAPSNLQDSLYTGASSDLDRVLSLCGDKHPDAATAHLYRGCLEAKVKPKRALHDLRMARMLCPRDPRPCLAAGAVFESIGAASKVLREYVEAMRRDPLDPYPLLAVCGIHTYFRPAKLDAAIDYATRAIKLRPGYVRAYAVRADVHCRAGNLKAALRDVCRALHLVPLDTTLLALKADYLLRLGRTCEAATACAALANACTGQSVQTEVAVAEEGIAAADAQPASILLHRPTVAAGPKHAGSAARGIGNSPPGRSSVSAHAGPGDRPTNKTQSVVGGVPQKATRARRYFDWQAKVLPPAVALRLQALQAEATLVAGSAAEAVRLLDQVLQQVRSGAAKPLLETRDLSLLAVAKHLAGDLAGAHASLQAAHKSAASGGGDSGKDLSTLWLRDGHLRLAMHDTSGALDAYCHATRADPRCALAHEGAAWARHMLRRQREASGAAGAGGPAAQEGSVFSSEGHVEESHERMASSDDDEPSGAEDGEDDSDGDVSVAYSAFASVAGSALALKPKEVHKRRRRELKGELAAFKRANKLQKGGMLRAELHRAFALHSDGQHSRAASELEEVARGLAEAAEEAPELGGQLENIRVFLSVVQLSAGQVVASMLTLRGVMDRTRGAGGLKGPLRLARFAQGTTLMKIGSLDSAAAILKEVASSFDDVQASQPVLGRSASSTKRSLSADALARRRNALLAFAAHYNLGLALERRGDVSEAVHAFETALRLAAATRAWGPPEVVPTPRLVDCHAARGMALLQLARAHEARASFNSALALESSGRPRLQALLGLGHTHFEVGDTVGARRAYSRAASAFPKAPAPRLALERLLHHTDDAPAALRCVAAALALSPGLPEALEVRAALRLSAWDTGGAIADLEASVGEVYEAAARAVRVDRCITLAMLRMQMGDQKRARSELDAIENGLTVDAPAAIALRRLSAARKLVATGFHAAKRGEWVQSAAHYDEAAALASAAQGLATIEGRPPEAAAVDPAGAGDARSASAEEKEARAEPPPALRPPAALVSEGMASGRARALTGRANFGAGLAYAFLDDQQQALARFDEAVGHRPQCGFAMYNRAVLRLAAGQCDLAELDLKECTQLLPLVPDGWLRKCEAIIAQGDKTRKAQALSDYAIALVVTDFDPRTTIKD